MCIMQCPSLSVSHFLLNIIFYTTPTDQRIGTATFLPLDSLQTPPPESTERLRAMAENDGRYRLAADVIRVSNDEYRRAVLYAVGNTVVCDSLDVARDICFSTTGRGGHAADRVKAVTLKGAVISKAGTMTGMFCHRVLLAMFLFCF